LTSPPFQTSGLSLGLTAGSLCQFRHTRKSHITRRWSGRER
jgi:hypothetical protein